MTATAPSALDVLDATATTLQNFENTHHPHSQPLTLERLRLVLDAVASGTAHTLVFPELDLRT